MPPNLNAKKLMTSTHVDGPVQILLVEDNAADALLTKEALNSSEPPLELTWVQDGVEAVNYLKREGQFATARRPDIILLDLNMPRKDGRQLLAELKADPALRRIPVVVLTTSVAEEDIAKAYDLQANCYMTKPIDMEQFIEAMKSFKDFWLQAVELPPR